MQIYDRIESRVVREDSLPNHIDLGRYYYVETKRDLTNRIINVGTEKFIDQGLLQSTNKSLQDLFCYFHNRVTMAGDNDFSIVPLIQSVKDKLFLNKFEKMLEQKLFHLEEIFRQPHYLLQRYIEKVNVSRAKRIPAKSYQNLASHTEDWLHKSIVNFKPRRILNEELDLNFDVYENQITIALIERCLVYLGSRIQEVHDISDFLDDYKKLLSERDDESGWYKKIKRNLRLIGYVYEDENYSSTTERKETLSKTQERLLQMSKRLKALLGSPVCDEVNHRMVLSLMTKRDVRPTNVIANHRHYRYVRELWSALNEVDFERSEEERVEYEQEVIDGVRCYSKAILAYVVQDSLDYNIHGSFLKWTASPLLPSLPNISFEETNDNRFQLTIGNESFYFVVLCNLTKIKKDKIAKNVYVLSLNKEKLNDKVISISPYDPDSIERVGGIIKSYIIRDYVKRINQQFEYPHSLRDYVNCIKTDDVVFDLKSFSYTFKAIPNTDLSVETAIELLKVNETFSKKSRQEKDRLKKAMQDLVEGINTAATILANLIVCIDCSSPIPRRRLRQLNYITCDCGFVLDSSATNHVVFHNVDDKYSLLSKAQWGMDYVEYDE